MQLATERKPHNYLLTREASVPYTETDRVLSQPVHVTHTAGLSSCYVQIDALPVFVAFRLEFRWRCGGAQLPLWWSTVTVVMMLNSWS